MIPNDHISIEELQEDFEYLTHTLEVELINKIVDKSDLEGRIKRQVVGLLGARLLESRAGRFEVVLNPCTNSSEVTIKFKYE